MKNNLKSMQRILSQLNFVLDKHQKKEAITVFFCMILSSALNLISVSAIYPFLQMILSPEKLKKTWYVEWIYVYYPDMTDKAVLLVIGMVIIVIYILKNVFSLFIAYVENSYASKFQYENSVGMLESYLKRPYQFFLNTNSGIIYRGISTDVNGVYQILLSLFTMLSELLTVLVLGIFLLVIDWAIALCAMALAGICFFFIVFFFKENMKSAGRDAQEASSLKNKYGYQAINGIKEIMVLGRREKFVEQFNRAALLEKKSSLINGFISACPDRILEGVCIGGFMGIVCVKIAIGTDLDTFVPILGTFAMGAFRILPSISKISSRVNSIIFYQPTLQSIYDNLREVESYEHLKKELEVGSLKDGQDENLRFNKEIEIKKISWKYQNTKRDVLHQTSLRIKKGEAVAFIGPSGAGKTTLADIIMGLLKPQEGEVMMDGIDIFTIPGQWTKIIGYVPQSVFLIDDTVRSNVAFGLDKYDISDEKVWDALEQAQLKEFVESLPYGLDTIVGERGVKFSGGQRQRIAIARALYENPDILVLDEATSALDNETETAVMESIDALQGNKTLIIVAHRLTTIRNCDVIYEIKDGTAVRRVKEEVLGK